MSKSNGRKDPAMLFYGSDFYDDEVVKLMSLEQEAVYMRLLWHAWREGSIPADLVLLAAVARVPARQFAKLWPGIAPKWGPSTVTGRLVNKRLEHERAQRAERTQKLSEAGIEGNRRRYGRSGGDADMRSGGDRQAIPCQGRHAIPSLTHSLSEGVSEGGSPPGTAEPERSPGDPGAGSAELREALLDRGVFRQSPARLTALIERLLADRWTAADIAEAAASVRGKTDEQRAGRLASLLDSDERRTAFGDDMARRKANGRT